MTAEAGESDAGGEMATEEEISRQAAERGETVARVAPHATYKSWSAQQDSLLEHQQTEFIARDYQLEMLNIAKQENTIVMMPTGSGKTYVAVLLIKHFINQVMTDPPRNPELDSPDWKRTFFLVNHASLVYQQAKVLSLHTGLDIGQYTGNRNAIDKWDKATWYREFRNHKILVMTCQIFQNMISANILSTENVNILVLDECHHAKENHPMACIMRDHWNPRQPSGRVLGLTASVIDKKRVSSICEVEKVIDSLRRVLKARLVTPREFSNQVRGIELPQPELQLYNSGDYGRDLLFVVNEMVSTLESQGQGKKTTMTPEQRPCYRNIKKIVNTLQKIITEIGVDAFILNLPDLKAEIRKNLSCNVVAPLISPSGEVSNKCVLYEIGEAVLAQMNVIENISRAIVEEAREVKMSAKFHNLMRYLIRLHSCEEKPRIIIFIETRRVVMAMYQYLAKLRKEVECCAELKAAFVLGGTAGKRADDEIESEEEEFLQLKEIKKNQERALLDFREGKCNILLATSVVEEGLDIPACNVVIRYDFPQTYRAYVQSRGRARQRPAHFVFFISEQEQAERRAVLKQFNDMEELLRKYAQADNPILDDEEEEMGSYSIIIPPLQVAGSQAKVTATMAIQRLNFYCSQLPKDVYTEILPTEDTVRMLHLFQTKLTLPKLCPLRKVIVGHPMATKKLAKMSAAMEALKALYEAQELTENFLPQFRQREANTLLIKGEDGRDVTVDQKLKIPTVLWRREMKDTFYMHSIIVKLEPSVEGFSECFATSSQHKVACFGILTRDRLPDMPRFDVYPRFGTVSVIIQYEREITEPSNQIADYLWFQEALFTHILDIKGVVMSRDALFKNYLILPLCRKAEGSQFRSSTTKSRTYLDIDRRFIAQMQSRWDRNHWKFGEAPTDLEKCMDCVLFPAYRFLVDHDNRNITGELYAVLRISDKTPQDLMRTGKDGKDEITYEAYHKSLDPKFKLENPHQKLLECRNVTRHYDFGSYKSNAHLKYMAVKPLNLIAEIHKVHPMPASLWSLATCLPSILWKLETLLLSKELTDRLYRDTPLTVSLGRPNLAEYFREDAVQNLQLSLERDREYKGEVNWVEALQVITHKSCQESYNLERLEFLGDRFLKFISTLFYYRTMPDKHEGWLSKYRSQLISNQNLALRASRTISLPRYILNKKINPMEHWIPPCFVPRRLSEELDAARDTDTRDDDTEDVKVRARKLRAKDRQLVDMYLNQGGGELDDVQVQDALVKLCELIPEGHLQTLSTKDVADSMEALIGITLSRYGYRKAVDLLDMIRIATFQSKGGKAELFNEWLYQDTPVPAIETLSAGSNWRDTLRTVEEKIGYTFKKPLYLLEALTHASYSQIDVCYQRLEFLGDAVLDILAVVEIYEHNPHHDQGKMTDLLAALVCNTTLSKICTKLELHKSLLYESVELHNVLTRFYMNFADGQLESWCTDLSLDRVFLSSVDEDTPDSIPIIDLEAKVVQTPKLLGDLVESVIGAIYLDLDEDLIKVRAVIWPWFEEFYKSYRAAPPSNPRALVNQTYVNRIDKSVVPYPGDGYRSIACVTLRSDAGKRFSFRTIGRDRETALDVSYGRAWHFHNRYLVQGEVT